MRYRKVVMTLVLLAGWAFAAPPGRAQQPAKMGPSEVTVGGAVTMPLTVLVDDLKRMPRTTVHVTNSQKGGL